VPFLNDLLTALSTVVKSSTDDIRGELQDRIVIHLSDMALNFGQEKIYAHYMKILQDIAPTCLADITAGLNGMERP
jgi:hypothetical protein